MVYAVIELSGKQLWVEPGKYYDVNKLDASPGETILLNRILLLHKSGMSVIGDPCIKSYTIRAKVLKHLKSRKIRVFKMKSKKNMRFQKGFRQNITRLLIERI